VYGVGPGTSRRNIARPGSFRKSPDRSGSRVVQNTLETRGLLHSTGVLEEQRFELQMLRPDGRPWGAPVTVGHASLRSPCNLAYTLVRALPGSARLGLLVKRAAGHRHHHARKLDRKPWDCASPKIDVKDFCIT